MNQTSRLLKMPQSNKRLQRTRRERAPLLSCAGEPLKRNVGQLSDVNENVELC
jgi:hypothetical protein